MNSEDNEVLHLIIQHYRGFTENRIVALRKCFEKPVNVYQAKEIAVDMAEALDEAGEYLLHPERFTVRHASIADKCELCEIGKNILKG